LLKIRHNFSEHWIAGIGFAFFPALVNTGFNQRPFLGNRFYSVFPLLDEQQPEEGIVSNFSSEPSSFTSSILTPQQPLFLPINKRLKNPSFFCVSAIFLPPFEI
jgi:hypothetical protein